MARAAALRSDYTESCADIAKQVDSNQVKPLLDLYHAQIIIRCYLASAAMSRLDWDVLAAGNPDRGELDTTRDINSHIPETL